MSHKARVRSVQLTLAVVFVFALAYGTVFMRSLPKGTEPMQTQAAMALGERKAAAWHGTVSTSSWCLDDGRTEYSVSAHSQWTPFNVSWEGDSPSGILNPGESASGTAVITWPAAPGEADREGWSISALVCHTPQPTVTGTPIPTETLLPGITPTATSVPTEPPVQPPQQVVLPTSTPVPTATPAFACVEPFAYMFISEDLSNYDIGGYRPGAEEKNVNLSASDLQDARPSFFGNHVVWAQVTDGGSEIWRANVINEISWRLTTDYRDSDPIAGPDQLTAFFRSEGGQRNLYVINDSGTTTTKVADNVTMASWSHTDPVLIFQEKTGLVKETSVEVSEDQIVISQPRVIAFGHEETKISPDGEMVASIYDGEVWVWNGGHLRKLTTDLDGTLSHLAWFLNNKYIAGRLTRGQQSDIVVIETNDHNNNGVIDTWYLTDDLSWDGAPNTWCNWGVVFPSVRRGLPKSLYLIWFDPEKVEFAPTRIEILGYALIDVVATGDGSVQSTSYSWAAMLDRVSRESQPAFEFAAGR